MKGRLIKERTIMYKKPVLVKWYDKHFLKVLAAALALTVFARVLHSFKIVI